MIYVGTFSKMLSPALRIGFAVVPPGLVRATSAIRQAADAGPPAVTAETLRTFIDDGHLDRHLRRARKVYAERYRAVRAAVASLAESCFTPLPSQAGLHMALLAPDTPDDKELNARSTRHGLQLSSLRRTYQHSPPQAGIVLGFGAIPTPDIPEAVELLASLYP